MTWAIVLGFLRRHWRVIAVLGALLFAFVFIHSWMERECARREVQLRQEYDALLRAAEAKNRDIETHWRKLVYEADRDHQNRLKALEAKYTGAVDFLGPVRLCPRSPVYPATVSRNPAPAPVDHGPADGDGLPGGDEGRDIGPGLARVAKAAETQTAQLIACQAYAEAIQKQRALETHR